MFCYIMPKNAALFQLLIQLSTPNMERNLKFDGRKKVSSAFVRTVIQQKFSFKQTKIAPSSGAIRDIYIYIKQKSAISATTLFTTENVYYMFYSMFAYRYIHWILNNVRWCPFKCQFFFLRKKMSSTPLAICHWCVFIKCLCWTTKHEDDVNSQ